MYPSIFLFLGYIIRVKFDCKLISYISDQLYRTFRSKVHVTNLRNQIIRYLFPWLLFFSAIMFVKNFTFDRYYLPLPFFYFLQADFFQTDLRP